MRKEVEKKERKDLDNEQTQQKKGWDKLIQREQGTREGVLNKNKHGVAKGSLAGR